MFANEMFSFDDINRCGWFGVFITADSPDWLVGDDNFIDIFFADFV